MGKGDFLLRQGEVFIQTTGFRKDGFIIKLIKIKHKYLPEDDDAIEIADLGKEVKAAFTDMESITETHFNRMNSRLENLKTVIENITNIKECLT